MKLRTMWRHIIESLRSIKRNGWMTFAAVSAVTVTLFIVGALFTIIFNVNNVSKQIEKDVKVRVEIDVKTSRNKENTLRKEISKISGVKKVSFSSKKNELDKITKTYNSNF